MVAVRVSDLVLPPRNGAALAAGDRSALVVAGTGKIGTDEPVVFCKVVVVASAQVRRDGRVQAKGSPCGHARLGPLEEQRQPGYPQRVIRSATVPGRTKVASARRAVISAAVPR